MGASLILMGIYTTAGQYIGRTWSLWLASLSFLSAPFWFNPLTFEWNVVVNDYLKYIRWMLGSSGGPDKSWDMWWTDENSYYQKMSFGSKMFWMAKVFIYIVMEEGIRRSTLFEESNNLVTPQISVLYVFVFLLGLVVLYWIYTKQRKKLSYPARRSLGIVIGVLTGLAIGIILVEDTNFIRYLLSAYYGLGAICLLGLLLGLNRWVKHLYFIHDLVCGHLLFVVIFVFAAVQIISPIQTWLLYHNALSSDVVVSDILRHARRNQQSAGGNKESEKIAKLKKIIAKHEETLRQITYVEGGSIPDSLKRNASTDAIASLIAPSTSKATIQERKEEALGGRVMSMSGLDVWGGIAFGDGSETSTQLVPINTVDVYNPKSSVPDFSFSQPDVMPPRL